MRERTDRAGEAPAGNGGAAYAARNPKRADNRKDAVLLEVDFAGSGNFMPFAASPDDCAGYGRELYRLALEGEFGEIADSDEERVLRGELEPPEGCKVISGEIVNVAEVEREALAELSRRLAEYNGEESKAKAEIDESYAAERKGKIAALLAVKGQKGWPLKVKWPGT